MPFLLELFSGAGSVGTAFRARGWEVFSVDIDASAEPTLVADVLHLQPADLPTHVDCIWASPPCARYSRARTRARTPRDLEGSDALVRKVLSLIDHYGGPDRLVHGESLQRPAEEPGGGRRASDASS